MKLRLHQVRDDDGLASLKAPAQIDVVHDPYRRELLTAAAGLAGAAFFTPMLSGCRRSSGVEVPYEPLKDRIVRFEKESRDRGWLNEEDEVFLHVRNPASKTDIVSIKGNRCVHAASTMKVFVLAAFYELVRRGHLSFLPRDEIGIGRMMAFSNNQETCRLMQRCGGWKKISAVISDLGYEGVDIMEDIPPSGRTYKNTIEPRALTHILEDLYNNAFIDPETSAAFLDEMSRTNNPRLKVPNAPTGKRYEKTGYLSGLHGSAGLFTFDRVVDTAVAPYAIAAFVQNEKKLTEARRDPSINARTWKANTVKFLQGLSSIIYWENMGYEGSAGLGLLAPHCEDEAYNLEYMP